MTSQIRKRDGRIDSFDSEKITAAILKATADVGEADVSWAKHLTHEVMQKIPSDEIPTVEGIQDIVEEVLIASGASKVAKSYILYRKKRQDERNAKAAVMGHLVDTKLSLNALKLLKARYLRRSPGGTVTEDPDRLFRRVAHTIAKADLSYEQEPKETEEKFFELLSTLRFLPNSPCLMNAGSEHAQLSSSMHIPLNDNLTEVFATMTQGALVHKCGAGVGLNFSKLRQAGAKVRNEVGVAAGPMRFLHLLNAAFSTVKQGGKRQGGNMAVLSINHPDIVSFITAKASHKQLQHFNLSVALTDDFIKAVVLDQPYTLKHNKTEVTQMSARQVFDIVVASAWRSADPGVLFWDRIQKDNPTPQLGKITGVSPCAEHALREYEMAFLGSINLAKHVKDGKPDYELLKETIHYAVHFLDNCIDLNDYPLEKAKTESQRNRKIGLGVMGLAHLLIQCRVPYDSEEGRRLTKEIMQYIRNEADVASENLARLRGTFPAWEESVYAQTTMEHKTPRKFRNATRMAISPTGSISIIANTSSGIEPLFSLSYVRKMYGGNDLVYLDPYLKRALYEEGLDPDEWAERIAENGSLKNLEVPEWMKKVFITTNELSSYDHIAMQATVQACVDNAVSKTVNLPHNATLLDVENAFLLAYKLGCKGITVYREGSHPDQVINYRSMVRSDDKRAHKSVREELKVLFANKTLGEFQ